MGIIIFLLVMIILGLSTYLFCMKLELKRITESMKKMGKNDSNLLLHQELPSKELHSLMIEINCLLEEMKQQEILFERNNHSLKKMMMNISHDLRTPLTSALGYIDILLSSNLSKEEQEKELRIIEERLKRLEELISSFFDFSKIIFQKEPLETEEVNIIAVIEESIAHSYEDYLRENRQIVFDRENSKIKIDSNIEMLTRIFDNLIGNALKHGIGDLEITVHQTESLKIVFRNQLKNKKLEVDKIFDEFYTEDISRTKGGTGLGLAIAKEFTEQLGGKIEAKKEKNYLKIIFHLPKKENHR